MEFFMVILSTAIPLSISFILAGLGEMFNQRAGIFNLGVEGIMLLGAFVGFFTVHHWNNNVLGLVCAMLVGGAMGLLMAVITVTFKATQGIAGIGLYMLGWGLSGTLFRNYVGGITAIEGITAIKFPLLSEIPILGPIFFQHNLLVYITFLLVPLAWYVLFKTAWGLKVRAVGTTPRAADTLGVSVEQIRYQCVILGGIMAGLAGAYLSICQTHMFADNITAGRGFIAVALVYFGRWHPVGIMGGALLFSLAHSVQRSIQVYGINFPYELAVVFPYVLVIVVLALSYKAKNLGPAALGRPYEREFRG
jgi:simple sugar transport system permease protein